MSTYLVALIVSDFKCRNGFAYPPLSKNVSVSVCARANAYNQTKFAFDASIEILEYFEEFYNITYPLSKLGKFILILKTFFHSY